MLLQQQKYQTAFKSWRGTVFCKCCIFRSVGHKTGHISSMDKIVFRIFMISFQVFMLQRYAIQNIQPLQKLFFQMLKMFMWCCILHFIILITIDIIICLQSWDITWIFFNFRIYFICFSFKYYKKQVKYFCGFVLNFFNLQLINWSLWSGVHIFWLLKLPSIGFPYKQYLQLVKSFVLGFHKAMLGNLIPCSSTSLTKNETTLVSRVRACSLLWTAQGYCLQPQLLFLGQLKLKYYLVCVGCHCKAQL